jgi:VCBS repeat-containing protein
VSITVTGVNDAPVANAQSVATAEDVQLPVTLTGTDPEGSALTWAIVTQPTHGTLTGAGASWTYTPAANYSGPDNFTFTVSDGTATSAPATVSITVTAANDAPVANAQSVSTPEDAPRVVTLTGTDLDGDALTFAIVTQPAYGTLTGSGASWTYTPAANYSGADAFTFTASDGTATSSPATVSISVTAVNDAPVADAQSVTTAQDVPLAVTLTGTDVEGSALTYTIVASPAHGTLAGSGATRTYTPAAGYSGADSFTFTVSDGTLASGVATVSITVTAATPPPATGVTLSVSAPSPHPQGTEVVFTATGQGSTGYQYRFRYSLNGGAFVVAQDWSSDNTWALAGTAALGSYYVLAEVRTSSAVTRDAYTSMTYQVVP